MTDPLRNKLDPLRKSAPEDGLSLFRAMSDACANRPTEQVVSASANMLVNAIRQKHARRADAEAEMRDVMGRALALLCDQHYDLQGNRRNVFPFAQLIDMPLIDLRGTRH